MTRYLFEDERCLFHKTLPVPKSGLLCYYLCALKCVGVSGDRVACMTAPPFCMFYFHSGSLSSCKSQPKLVFLEFAEPLKCVIQYILISSRVSC